ncbi:MAG: hypothetical protein WA726_09920 [Acidimicrobiia bacterium]
MSKRSGERVLLTRLVTDIVDSTKRAVELGDTTWRAMIVHHYQDVRTERWRSEATTW